MDYWLLYVNDLEKELLKNKRDIKFEWMLSLGFVVALVIDLLFISIESKAIHASFFAIIIAAIVGSMATIYARNKTIHSKLDSLCIEKYNKSYDFYLIDIMNEK